VNRQASLFQVVDALRPPCALPRGLHSRQEQRDQDADNRDHDQQLDERKSPPTQSTRAMVEGPTQSHVTPLVRNEDDNGTTNQQILIDWRMIEITISNNRLHNDSQ
jgi:hypothetical protein